MVMIITDKNEKEVSWHVGQKYPEIENVSGLYFDGDEKELHEEIGMIPITEGRSYCVEGELAKEIYKKSINKNPGSLHRYVLYGQHYWIN